MKDSVAIYIACEIVSKSCGVDAIVRASHPGAGSYKTIECTYNGYLYKEKFIDEEMITDSEADFIVENILRRMFSRYFNQLGLVI